MADFFKVAIIDDERDSANALIAQLKRYPRFHIEGVAENAASGIEMLKKVMPDLLFLDVELPEMYGMELLPELDNEIKDNMRVVFYTAHDKYMINALRNSAFDFLLKPIDRKEFEIVISRFLLDNETKPVVIEKIPVASSSKESSFMVILPTGEMRMVKTAEVGFSGMFQNVKSGRRHLCQARVLRCEGMFQRNFYALSIRILFRYTSHI